MIYPSIHLNGTSKKMLEDTYQEAYALALRAEAAFGKIEFNQRDYYPQGDAAWIEAKAQTETVRKHFEAIQVYLGEIINHLYGL